MPNAITTPSTGLVEGDIDVPVADGTMPAYRAMPHTGGAFPVILVVQEIFGVNEHIRDICRRFAQLGYLAIAPQLYVRQGDPKAFADTATLIRDLVARVADAQVMSDLDACVAWAAHSGQADASKLGITGFCWGGRTVLMYAAHNPGLTAAVAWYGPTARVYHAGDTPALQVATRIKAAVLGLYGGNDTGIPADTVKALYAALAASGNTHSAFVIYPDTPHAFFADHRPSYTKLAADDGWARATAWFARQLA